MLRGACVFVLCVFSCAHDAPSTGVDGAADAQGATDALAEAQGDATDAQADAGPRLCALETVTPVFSETEFPARNPESASAERRTVVRVGYLRKGSCVRIKGEPLKKSNCADGWYELRDGGFVCGKFASTDPKHPDLADAPHPPYTDRPLPYEYGMSMGAGVPLYFRLPTKAEREQLEANIPISKNGQKKGKTTPAKDDEKPHTDDNPYAPGPSDTGNDAWYLEPHTGEKARVAIDDLHKTARGDLVERRMLKGFYLALDTKISRGYSRRRGSVKFWRTTRGLLAPFEHILVHESKVDLKGVWLDASDAKKKLPLAFVVGAHTRRYKIAVPDAGAGTTKAMEPPPLVARRGSEPVERFTVLAITGKSVNDEHAQPFYELSDGSGEWVRAVDVAVTKPGPKPADIAGAERWIDVNLKTQSLVAFEGDTAVFATLLSSGRHDDDPEKDHRTPKGDFRIREKHIAATMEQDTATDGPYSIEDVPWIMYFHGGYALHGAFWHARFGHERSHGCVNLAPIDAKDLFGWVGPKLPEDWHGVRATDANPGTRVIVHD